MAITLFAVTGSSVLMPILGFILFGSAAWLLMDLFSSRASTAEQRLDEFKDPNHPPAERGRGHAPRAVGRNGDAHVGEGLARAGQTPAAQERKRSREAAGCGWPRPAFAVRPRRRCS